MATVISKIGDKRFEWSFGGDNSISLDGKKIQADVQKILPGQYSVLLNGKSICAAVHRNDLIYTVIINGNVYNVEIETSLKKLNTLWSEAPHKKQLDMEVRSPMPGMVVRCEVKEGEKIAAGDGLLILEAMKMENEIRATIEGTVKKILVFDRQVVEKGELLLLIE